MNGCLRRGGALVLIILRLSISYGWQDNRQEKEKAEIARHLGSYHPEGSSGLSRGLVAKDQPIVLIYCFLNHTNKNLIKRLSF